MSNNNSGKKGNVGSSIPAKMRETVQNLKEIVNCTEQEIIAMLKECNMDPNEAVHRLLNQDTFHEVKSKRERKKETKETAESRPQSVSSSSARGVRAGADYAGHNTAQINSDVTRGKHLHKKENGSSVGPYSSILGSGAAANSSCWSVAPLSNNDATGNIIQAPGLSDRITLPSQPSSTLQHNWLGVPGQLSMADIVKMGRPQRKPFSTLGVSTEVCNSSHKVPVPNTSQGGARDFSATVIPSESNQEFHYSQDNFFKATEISHEPSIAVGQHKSLDEWPLVDSTEEVTLNNFEVSGAPAIYPDPPASSSLHIDGADLHLSSQVDNIENLQGHADGENLPTDSTISEGQLRVDNSDSSSCLNDESFMRNSTYQSQRHPYEQHEAKDVHRELSSAAANLQRLSIHDEEQGATSTEENSAVIIPGHLQVIKADCSHLSFGSFGSGVGASLPGAFSSKPPISNLEVSSVAENSSPIDYSDSRKPDYYNSDQLRTASDDSFAPKAGINYDVASASQPEVIGDDTFTAELVLNNLPSVSSFAFSSTTLPNDSAYTHALENSQMQILAPLLSLMQQHTNSVPSNLLTGTAQPLRESDLPILNLRANESMPTKYSPSMSSLGGPTNSVPEVLNPGLFSTLQSTPQTASSTTFSTGPALPQHLPFPPYSQPTLPLGPLPSTISYPVHPQSIAYMPFPGSSAFHQASPTIQSAGMKYALPQFKSSMPLNNLPQSLPVASGYRGFGSSFNIPGTFMQNPSNVVSSTSVGYEEALRSQYKGGDNFCPLHQSNNSIWLHGAGSRTLPTVQASTYYGIQGQNQQGSSIHRQVQQPTHMGMMMGHPSLYHSQPGVISREHQQLPSQGNLNVSPGQPSQQSHHLWQQTD